MWTFVSKEVRFKTTNYAGYRLSVQSLSVGEESPFFLSVCSFHHFPQISVENDGLSADSIPPLRQPKTATC